MDRLTFIQIEKGNAEHYELAKRLWIPFSKELDEHEGIAETEDEILHDLTRRINIQGIRENMHFEVNANCSGLGFDYFYLHHRILHYHKHLYF